MSERTVAFVVAFCSLATMVGFARTSSGTITGLVKSTQTLQPISSVNVTIDGTSLGTATNERGEFAFQSVPIGLYSILVRMVGYEDHWIKNVSVEENEQTNFDIQLNEIPIPMKELQVEANRLHRQRDLTPGLLSVTSARVKGTAGVAEDVFRTLQAMPGVLASSDNSSQLIIRGGGPDETVIIMDDIELLNPYRLFGFVSMFNPDAVSDISLITAGFPARYGDRLSAVLDIANREGDKSSPLRGKVNVSITNANVILNGRLPLGVKGSYFVSARRTYYDLVAGAIAKSKRLVAGDVALPNFVDVQSKIVLDPSVEHKIIINGLASRDNMHIVPGSERSSKDSIVLDNTITNYVLGARWEYLPSKNLFSKLSLSWYNTKGDAGQGGSMLDPSMNGEQSVTVNDTIDLRFYHTESNRTYEYTRISANEELSFVADRHIIEAGFGADLLHPSLTTTFRPDTALRGLLVSQSIPFVEQFSHTTRYHRLHGYVQDNVHVTEQLTVQPGIRIEHYGINKRTYLQPRVNASFVIDPTTTLKAAWGIYRQSPGYERLIDQNIVFDLSKASLQTLEAERASHYVLGLEHWFDIRWKVTMEGYYKKYRDLVVQEIQEGTRYKSYPVPGGNIRQASGWTDPVAVRVDSLTPTPINGASGNAYGFEILLEKRASSPGDRFSGWIGYSNAHSERERDGITTPFRFDRRHSIDVVLDYTINTWLTAGVKWVYGSGFPYTPPLSIFPRIVDATVNGVHEHLVETDTRGNTILDLDYGGQSNRQSARLPPYHRLDIRFTAKADFWDLDWDFYLDIINAYNRKNVLGYHFYIADDLSIKRNELAMFPILPTVGVAVRF